jgi:hypothetical protein
MIIKKDSFVFQLFAAGIVFLGISASHLSRKNENISKDQLPSKPLNGEFDFKLRENVILRESDQKDEFIFNQVIDFAVDSQENLYLLDFKMGSSRILKYGREGDFINSVGQTGQGPGEYAFPIRIIFDQKDNLYIVEQNRLICYDARSNFVGTIQLPFVIDLPDGNIWINGQGIIYAVSQDISEEGVLKTLVKYDPGSERVTKILDISSPEVRISGKREGGVVAGIFHAYVPRNFLRPYLQDQFLFATASQYMVKIFNGQGHCLGNIKRSIKPELIHSSEIEAIKRSSKKIRKSADGFFFPKYRPYIKQILADEKGRIYIVRVPSVLSNDAADEMDIFNRDGQYLYRAKIPFLPKIIKNGAFYVLATDHEEKRAIKKMMIINYADF